MATALPGYGTTTFLPGATGTAEHLYHFLDAVDALMANPPAGASVPGCNLEGPFLNPLQKGAIPESSILPPDPALLRQFLAGGRVRLITMAPDMPGISELIQFAVAQGVTVSLGHTRATLDQVITAHAMGATHVTHLFNGMPPMHHRQPGMVGGGLTLPGLTVELIADLVHLHPGALKLAVMTKGVDKCVLITDSMAALGMSDGEYALLDQQVFVKNGEARLADGTLAGSTLSQDKALRNMVHAVGVSPSDALTMLTANPARQAKLSDRGRLAPGLRADLVWLDGSLNVRSAWVEGRAVYGP
jgi:N-acetylglucosamine-6-phosphate deacetylase